MYEKIENGECKVFKLNSEFGEVYHMFIKREIPMKLNGYTYYDLVTPYGYGGPLIVDYKEGCKEKLVYEFEIKFGEYCKERNIVSEFVRFHPIVKNANDFKRCYEIEHVRDTVGTNLFDFEDPFQSEFSKSCRKNVRKALNEKVSYRITKDPNNLKRFKDVYFSTMNRNQASEYYYFDNEYFSKCMDLFGDNIVVVEALYGEEIIAMGFYFIYGDKIHIHLSGTLSEYLYLSPAYILRYAITLWGKENGFALIHHGGGRSNSPEDSLYKFKKQFGKNTEFFFYTGKKVWNEEVYNELSRINSLKENTSFFPAYRS
nr:GNAT family N-acetyltransferase [Halobacillus sp. A5]